MMHIHARYLYKSLKRRKLKNGQYNEQYKTRNEKTVVHMTMHQKAKDVATQTKIPFKTRDDCIC